ncbi:MAG: hypothetical protein JXM79_00295 [Sedimentisphaerales bacterium]|nr:hypothetical protein [Sedimentisphaerales bacterium]
MSANLDRFSCGVTPSIPDEVGHCAGCGGVMYDYEVTSCNNCGSEVHEGCTVKCHGCEYEGCKACLTQSQENLEWYCPDCLTPTAKAARKCAETGSHRRLRYWLDIRRKRGA